MDWFQSVSVLARETELNQSSTTNQQNQQQLISDKWRRHWSNQFKLNSGLKSKWNQINLIEFMILNSVELFAVWSMFAAFSHFIPSFFNFISEWFHKIYCYNNMFMLTGWMTGKSNKSSNHQWNSINSIYGNWIWFHFMIDLRIVDLSQSASKFRRQTEFISAISDLIWFV